MVLFLTQFCLILFLLADNVVFYLFFILFVVCHRIQISHEEVKNYISSLPTFAAYIYYFIQKIYISSIKFQKLLNLLLQLFYLYLLWNFRNLYRSWIRFCHFGLKHLAPFESASLDEVFWNLFGIKFSSK